MDRGDGRLHPGPRPEFLGREVANARISLSGTGAQSVSALIGPYAERVVELRSGDGASALP